LNTIPYSGNLDTLQIWYFVNMRRTVLLAILTALSFSLTACRADRSSEQPQSTDSAQPAPAPASSPEPPLPTPSPTANSRAQDSNDTRPLIVCFGDSLTAGYGAEFGKSYPDYLQADIDAKGFHYRVVNQGISGNTTKDGVERLDSIIALKPAVVVVEFGGNDGLRGLRIEDSRANLDRIVATLKSSGIRVALAGITLPPDYGPDYIKQFNDTYTLLAKKYNVPLLPFLLKDVFGVDGLMQADRTHATAEGNKVVANNVLPLVLPMLKK
jgi:acyl-CoA thioesterase I